MQKMTSCIQGKQMKCRGFLLRNHGEKEVAYFSSPEIKELFTQTPISSENIFKNKGEIKTLLDERN